MTKQYTSKALWPLDSGIVDSYGKSESSDSHDTIEQAESVCRMLEREGLGGLREIFPLKTWVEKTT